MCECGRKRRQGGGKGEGGSAHTAVLHTLKILLSPRENSLVGVGSNARPWTKADKQTGDGMEWEGMRREE